MLVSPGPPLTGQPSTGHGMGHSVASNIVTVLTTGHQSISQDATDLVTGPDMTIPVTRQCGFGPVTGQSVSSSVTGHFISGSVTSQHMTILVTRQCLSGPVTSQGVSSLVTDHFASGQSPVEAWSL